MVLSSLFDTPASQLIPARQSWRSYRGEPIGPETADRLMAFFDRLPPAPFGSRTRLHIVDAGPGKLGRIPGTYGMIKGARDFLVGVVERGPRDMEDFGFVFELLILKATEMGLGTCWMGATVDRGLFAEKAGLERHETIAAISPVGHTTQNRSLTDSVARLTIRAANRKPWKGLFFDEGFSLPLTQEKAGDHGPCLEMLRLAPSATNKQPWRVLRHGEEYHLYLQRTKGYDRLTKAADMQRIDMGIAMCHFALAASEAGLPGAWADTPPNMVEPPPRTEYNATWKI